MGFPRKIFRISLPSSLNLRVDQFDLAVVQVLGWPFVKGREKTKSLNFHDLVQYIIIAPVLNVC